MNEFDLNEADVELDATELVCPMPLLKTKQMLNKMGTGEKLMVVATDPGSVRDFRSFIDLSSNELLGSFERQGRYYYMILKGS